MNDGQSRLAHWRAGPSRAAAVLLSSIVLVAHAASAETRLLGGGFDLERFSPTPAGDRFDFVPEAATRPAWCNERACWGAISLRGFFAYRPITVKADDPPDSGLSRESTVNNARLHLGAAWTPAEFLQISADVPLDIYQGDLSALPGGYGPPASQSRFGTRPDPTDIGDVRFGLRFRQLPLSERLRVGGLAYVFVPTGDRERLMGDGPLRWDALGLVQYDDAEASGWSVAGNVGYGWRPKVEIGDAVISSGFEGGVAAAFQFAPALAAQVEARFDQWRPFCDDRPSPGVLVALGPRFSPDHRWAVQGTMLAGLTDAPGVPNWGATLTITYVPATWGRDASQ